MNLARIFAVLLVTMMVFACSSKKKDDDKILPAEMLYNNSMALLEEDKHKKAIEGFEELERTYPYSKWATKAQIMSAYASFNSEEYTDAIVTLEKFIALYPGNKDIEYAYYLKAICYYQQISDVMRDQSYSVAASNAFKELMARFPASKYTRDAQGKLDLVQDHLAGKEVTVGRFYLKQRKYIAAINRFKEVVDKYQTTAQVPEALHRLVEANTALGLKDEARKYAAVLGYNYPGSKWYGYSYALIEGKNLDAGFAGYEEWLDLLADPFKQLKSQKNLVDNVDRDIPVTSDEENPKSVLPLKIEPKSGDRGVTVGTIKNDQADPLETQEIQPHKAGTLKRLGGWFKNIKLPFVDK